MNTKLAHLVAWLEAKGFKQQAAILSDIQETITRITQVQLGVGNGDGQLFVYGDHSSIKECQRKLIEREEFRNQAEKLREQLAAAEALSVKSILLRVTPGSNGQGVEEYAKSVIDVVEMLSNLSERAERAEDLAYMHKATDTSAGRTWQQQAEFLKKKLLEENAEKQALETLRPIWAQGFDSASVAAQVNGAALAEIWKHLGVDNQTAAIQKLKELTPGSRPDLSASQPRRPGNR